MRSPAGGASRSATARTGWSMPSGTACRAWSASELPRPTPVAHARYVEGGASCFHDRTCRYPDCIRGLSAAVPVSAGVGFGPSLAYQFDGQNATRRRLHALVFALECRPWCRARHTADDNFQFNSAYGRIPALPRPSASVEDGALSCYSGKGLVSAITTGELSEQHRRRGVSPSVRYRGTRRVES